MMKEKDYIIEKFYYKDKVKVYKHYRGANGTLASGHRELIRVTFLKESD